MSITRCRPIKGFPGYAITESGEVVSFKHNPPLIRKPIIHKGYKQVALYVDGAEHTIGVHVLVAKVFLGDRPTGLVVDHIDGNKMNNHYTNLRYCTNKDNLNNPNTLPKMGLGRCKAVIAIKDGVEQSFESCTEMCRRLGLKNSDVSLCLSNKSGRRTSHGYTFRWG